VIEIADSPLEYDRGFKGSLYAKAGIADYWIINLFHEQIEVYRRPIADNEAEFGVS
jgi:Uma2 family endonuclease